MAEPIGLALGALGVVGLYSTSLQILNQIDSARNLEKSANPLHARLTVTTHLLRIWGDKNGIKDDALLNPHHPAFDDPSARHAIYSLLASIENMMADKKRLSDGYGMTVNPPISNQPVTMGVIKAQMAQMSLNSQPTSWKIRAKWAVVDEAKFSRLIGELEGIVDRLYKLATPNETLLKLDELRSRIDGEPRFCTEIQSYSKQKSRLVPAIEWRKLQHIKGMSLGAWIVSIYKCFRLEPPAHTYLDVERVEAVEWFMGKVCKF